MNPYGTWKPTSTRRQSHFCLDTGAAVPETNAAHPGLQKAGGEENGERRVRGHDSRRSYPEAGSGAGRGKGPNLGAPSARRRRRRRAREGAPVSLTTAPGRSLPSGPGEGREREGSEGTPPLNPTQGRRLPEEPSGLSSRRPGSRGPVPPRPPPTVYPRSRSLSS